MVLRASVSKESYSGLKSSLDFAGAFLGLLLTLPLLMVAAVLIKLEDGGPVLYRRRVLGRGGREFKALKLRTMRTDADEWLLHQPALLAEYEKSVKLKNDPRITRIGWILRRLSIDELPQLINVLRGEMSLVGPRMITRDELGKYGDHAKLLLSVRPGLTGLWQVNGRQDLTYETRVLYDMQYVAERSLMLDMQILAMTIPAVLSMRGAH